LVTIPEHKQLKY